MTFQPSININYDAGNLRVFENYVPNIKQLDIIKNVLRGMNTEGSHSHLLIGPYGAGKSLVAAMISSLISNNVNSKEFQTFLSDVQMVSPLLHEEILNSIHSDKKWFTIRIVGKTGIFEDVILESVQKQLLQEGIQISLKNDSSYILELISLWEKEYPEVYKKLKGILASNDIYISDFIANIELNSGNEIGFFKEIYPLIMAGTTFFNPGKLPFIEQLEHIYQQLSSKNIGIFIIFDEFGRFLQSVYADRISETMQQIQDLAELTNRSDNACTLFITHTGLEQYLKTNLNYKKDELERVQKRFTEYHLESDSSIFYRSAFKFFKGKRTEKSNLFLMNEYEEIKYGIMKFNLFPEMAPEEIEGTIIDGCQPIHPLTIKLLPALSNILGQNDRTMYSFLFSFKENEEVDQWYYADHLFDYFYPEETVLLTLDTLKFYRLAIAYQLSHLSIRVIKLATLFGLVNNKYSLKRDFLAFALGVSEEDINASIQEIISTKLMRFNTITKSYELYEGSLIDLDQLLIEHKGKHLIDDLKRLTAISSIFNENYLIPHEYNASKSITRFIEIQFTFTIEEMNIGLNDGVLQLIIPKTHEQKKVLMTKMDSIKSKDIIFGILEVQWEDIKDKVDDYIALKEMLTDIELLKQDSNLKEELEMLADSTEYQVAQKLEIFKNFSTKNINYYSAQLDLSNIHLKRNLESKLSEWMWERFPLTPEIRNESFNKFNVMSVQKKAAYTLLDQILEDEFDGEFLIEGNGPDYLIQATTFKNLQFNWGDLNNQPDQNLKALRESLLTYIEQNERGSINELFNISLNEPFGIRKPIVPLLVIALIRDKWNSMTFYAKDFNIPKLNTKLLYDILDEGIGFYDYEIYELNQEENQILENINSVFFDSMLSIEPHLIFKNLNKWLLNLPRITQISQNQSLELQEFKRLIRSSESDTFNSLEKFAELDLNKEKITQYKEELEGFLQDFINQIERKTLEVLNINTPINIEMIKEQYSNQVTHSPKFRHLIELFMEENWVRLFTQEVVGIKIEDWSDITLDSYLSTLKQLINTNTSSEIRLLDGENVISVIQETDFSVKGRNIYQQVNRLVHSAGRTMNSEEVKYILYRVLTEIE